MVSLRRVARIVLAVAVVSLVVIGTLPAVQASSIGVPVVPRSTGTLDERFAQIAMLVPAFGGMYYAGDTLVVYLTNPAAKPAALQAIGAFFGPAVLMPDGVQVRPATYGFLQLMQWHARMRSLFALPGVVMLDIDEMANRLKVGVAEAPISGTTSTASFRAVEVALTQLGVPRTAVTIVPMQPFATSATLRDNTRPIEGGIQIAFSMFLCTLGFNGVRSGVAGFVVNSHCTDVQGQNTGTQHYQPSVATGNLIGVRTTTTTPNSPGRPCSSSSIRSTATRNASDRARADAGSDRGVWVRSRASSGSSAKARRSWVRP